MAESRIRITIGATYDELPMVRHFLRQVLPSLDETTEALYLGAVTEIVVNAIDAQREGTIDIAVHLDPLRAVVITDSGPGFDPDAASSTKPGNLGQGIVIAKALVSGLRIDQGEDGTTVTLPFPHQSEVAQ